jgi:hypothetical protein
MFVIVSIDCQGGNLLNRWKGSSRGIFSWTHFETKVLINVVTASQDHLDHRNCLSQPYAMPALAFHFTWVNNNPNHCTGRVHIPTSHPGFLLEFILVSKFSVCKFCFFGKITPRKEAGSSRLSQPAPHGATLLGGGEGI